MTQSIQTRDTFRIHVIAASPAASLAILPIAGILGIEPQQAADRLASLPTVLADDVPGPQAQRVSALLMAFGFLVRLDPTLSCDAAIVPCDDMAVQAVPGGNVAALAGALADRLGGTAASIAAALLTPEGLVMRAMTARQVLDLRRALRSEKALRLLTSNPASAIFDAFARPASRGPVPDLARLGLARCAFSGAVAARMNAATAGHLARRTGGRLAILNRDFQRFDLILTGARGLAEKELADFLAVRPSGLARGQMGGVRTLLQVIETDLPRRVAEQFTADYASIGVDVSARLCGSLENT